MSVESDIREKVAEYLRGELSLLDLRSWVLAQTWNQDGVPRVAHDISFVIDEASSGNLSSRSLDDALRRLSAGRSSDLAHH